MENCKRKRYPRVPRRICILEDAQCKYVNFENDDRTILDWCFNCGILSESFMRGSLADLRTEINRRVMFFEKIDCEANFEKAKNFNKPEYRGSHISGYHKTDDNKLYHYLRADLTGTEDICTLKRNEDKSFDNECFKRDINHINILYNKIDTNEKNDFEKIKINYEIGDRYKAYKAGEFSLLYHQYSCEQTGFKEFIIPIFTGLNKKGLMGMLLFGQYVFKDDLEGIDQEIIKDAQTNGRYFDSVDDLFNKIGKALGDFIYRMHQRVKLNRREYLFNLQTNLQTKYAFKNDEHIEKEGEKWNTTIINIFKDLAEKFWVNYFILFMPDLSMTVNLDSNYFPSIKIKQNDSNNEIEHTKTNVYIKSDSIKEEDKYNIPLENLSFKNGYRIEDDNKENTSFYGSKDKQHFFGVLVEWNKKWYDNVKNNNGDNIHDGFFTSIISLCRALIVTRVAFLNSMKIKSFSETSIHDLAQKSYVLDLHNRAFEWDILDAERNNVFRLEALEKLGDKNIRVDFKNNCMEYRMQMQNCATSIGFLQRVLEQGNLKEKAEPKEFIPYTQFLKNFRRQFNNPFFRFHGQRKLFMSWPYEDDKMNADPVMIERALTNLIENAFKFAYELTNIYLEHMIENISGKKYHVFRVTNYCTGIKKEMAETIFERGKRGDNNRPGQGIGLWNAKKYAELHDGKLKLETGVIGEKDENGKEIGLKSRYNLNFIQELHEDDKFKFYDRHKEKIYEYIDDISEKELSRLKTFNDKEFYDINPVAKKEEKTTLYEEIYRTDITGREMSEKIKKEVITFDRVKLMCEQPTYAVTFKMSIPFNPSFDKTEEDLT
ncbi:MAG: ATP-binding protein [Eubacterium sp.]|jgi:hypothetical protein|nr:ATP-binding protein [Eubacterium sp.]